MVLKSLLDTAVQNVVEYCNTPEARTQFESKVLAPALHYLSSKFSWSVRLFQAVAVLVFIQTVILLWLLVREMRRPPVL